MPESNISSYNQRAEAYETKWEKYLQHTHKRFLEEICTSDQDVLLDLSCGTGLLAEELLSGGYPFKKLVLNDPSQNMLAIAKERLAPNTKISFTNYPVEHLELRDRQFDRIFCLNAFHFYTDHGEILNEIYSLLKPGGHFYILDWNRSGFFTFINRIITWSVSEYIDTRSFAEMEDLLSKSSFCISSSTEWQWRYWNFFLIEAVKNHE